MLRFLLALVLLSPLLTHAVDGEITCTVPTLDVAGNTLTTLAGFRLYGGFSNTVRQTKTVAQGCRFIESNLTSGPHAWYVTAFTASAESVPSNPVSLTVAAPECGAAPAPETRQLSCPLPTIGSWTQTNPWVSAPAPTCWVPAWLPTEPPEEVCAAPGLTTASTSAYQFKGATLPLALVGIVPAGSACGPETMLVNGVKYCALAKSQVDLVVWPSDLALTEFWARAQ